MTVADPKEGKGKMILRLEANDGKVFEVEEDVAFQSNLIKKMLADLQIDDPDSPQLKEALPISSVDGNTLEKILEFCTKNRNATYIPKGPEEDPRVTLSAEDEKWMDLPSDQLTHVLLGANYLDIPRLIDIITQKVANMASGKTVEEIREIYGLVNDFTPEEEEEIRRRFEWVEA